MLFAETFLAYSILAIPLGLALGFLHPHAIAILPGAMRGNWPVVNFLLLFLGIYLTVALPEELLFRGILQNILCKTIKKGPPGVYGLIITAIVFGAAHLHHRQVPLIGAMPLWRLWQESSTANVYRTRQRLCASALIHALVDTIWHFWF